MTSKACAAVLLSGLLAGCAGGPATRDAPRDAVTAADDQRILVMIADPDIGRFDLRGARSGAYRLTRNYPGRPAGVARVLGELAAEYRLRPVDGWPMRSLGVHCAVFEVGPDTSVAALIAQLAADPRVESAQPMQHFELKGSDGTGAWDDPYHPLQRSLEDLRIAEAHRWSTGRGVRVAVIDTGVDVTHPELRGQIAELRDFIGDGAATADRHGTAVAGVIASLAGNQRGIVGIAPGARLLALKACEQRHADGQGVCTSFSLARAIDHAIFADSDVLNLSLGGPHDPLLERLLIRAIERGIAVVAALGGTGERDSFPANMEGVIAVGDDNALPDARWLRAPGLDVLTLVPPDGYDFLSGNSIAAAHVSGIVALLLEREPALRATVIGPLLARTSQRVERDVSVASVMVNACAALAEIADEPLCDVDFDLARAAGTAPAAPRLKPD